MPNGTVTDRCRFAAPRYCARMDLELTGKKAIVTGGSRGIGKAVVRQLALEGADVGIAARDEQRIADATAELSALTGRRIVGQSCDTGDDESVRAMVAELSARSAASTSS